MVLDLYRLRNLRLKEILSLSRIPFLDFESICSIVVESDDAGSVCEDEESVVVD